MIKNIIVLSVLALYEVYVAYLHARIRNLSKMEYYNEFPLKKLIRAKNSLKINSDKIDEEIIKIAEVYDRRDVAKSKVESSSRSIEYGAIFMAIFPALVSSFLLFYGKVYWMIIVPVAAIAFEFLLSFLFSRLKKLDFSYYKRSEWDVPKLALESEEDLVNAINIIMNFDFTHIEGQTREYNRLYFLSNFSEIVGFIIMLIVFLFIRSYKAL